MVRQEHALVGQLSVAVQRADGAAADQRVEQFIAANVAAERRLERGLRGKWTVGALIDRTHPPGVRLIRREGHAWRERDVRAAHGGVDRTGVEHERVARVENLELVLKSDRGRGEFRLRLGGRQHQRIRLRTVDRRHGSGRSHLERRAVGRRTRVGSGRR